ncbi:HAD family hydrolase [Agrococcus sp. KRD186]|uniref:HAD family hydrolase n=1 Tax=Agrococcus sp. KRD186 TaxID=2729730 RepID=UPI0019D0A687
MRPTIVFDFDGTIAIGSGPLLAYARLVAPHASSDYLHRAEAALEAFERGDGGYRDGYDVVGSLAAADGVGQQQMSDAYLGSRAQLGTELAPVTTVPELTAFLDRLRQHARLELATNAPEAGIDRVLELWGVRERFDALHFAVGKPAGLRAVVARAIERGPVLAVGDIDAFDLAPARALGADTALVGATAASSPASTTMRGASLADIIVDIEHWAASAGSSTAAPSGASTTIER